MTDELVAVVAGAAFTTTAVPGDGAGLVTAVVVEAGVDAPGAGGVITGCRRRGMVAGVVAATGAGVASLSCRVWPTKMVEGAAIPLAAATLR